MSRYPQGIQGRGATCSVCGQAKYIHARVCKRCNPVFSSWSVAMNWAREHASGPCVMMYRTITVGEHGYRYAIYEPDTKGAAA